MPHDRNRPEGAVRLVAGGQPLCRCSGSACKACQVGDRPDASKRYDGRSAEAPTMELGAAASETQTRL
jgi:hypothetical protein